MKLGDANTGAAIHPGAVENAKDDERGRWA